MAPAGRDRWPPRLRRSVDCRSDARRARLPRVCQPDDRRRVRGTSGVRRLDAVVPHGLRLTAVAICYVLPTFVAVGGAYLATFGFVLASYGSAEVLALLVALAFQAAFLFALCWWLGVFVVLPAAFVRVSRLRSLRTGLHVRRVLGLVARRRYLGAWLLGTILSLTVGWVLLLSSYVLVGAFPMFYLLVALIRYISQTHPESGSAGRRVDEPISGGVDPPT